jgi:hypothetical protein
LFNWRSASAFEVSSSAQFNAIAISATWLAKLSLDTVAETLGLDKIAIKAVDLIALPLRFT